MRSETGGGVYEYIFDQWGKRLGVQNGSTGSNMEVSLYWPNGGLVLGFDWGLLDVEWCGDAGRRLMALPARRTERHGTPQDIRPEWMPNCR